MTSKILKKKTIQLDFASLDIYEDLIISTIHEGVVFDTPHLEKLYEVFLLNFSDRPFGYIANRINDYTVNPVCYIRTNEIESLVGMAVFCHNQRNFDMANFTKPFFKRPYEPFYSLDECIVWIQKLLTEKS